MSRGNPDKAAAEAETGDYYSEPQMRQIRGANPQKAPAMGYPIPRGDAHVRESVGRQNYRSSGKPMHATTPKGTRTP